MENIKFIHIEASKLNQTPIVPIQFSTSIFLFLFMPFIESYIQFIIQLLEHKIWIYFHFCQHNEMFLIQFFGILFENG